MKLKFFASIAVLSLFATIALGQDSSGTPNYQKIADALRAIADEVAKMGPQSVTPPVNPPQPVANQMPVLNDTRVTILKKMQVANSPDWLRLKATADASVAQYDDNGRAAAIIYRVTGDATYAGKSYGMLMSALNSPDVLNANNVRQFLLEFNLIYYWIRDALTADQKVPFETAIGKWADFALGRNQANVNLGGFRTGDSDQTIGQLFGLLFMDAAGIGPGNYGSQISGGATPTPVGGLTATAADMTTARNAVKLYCTKLAHGGTWMESCEYNSNTVTLLLLGHKALRDIYGVDYFPEISEWSVSACDAVLTSYTPDMKSRIEWGDDERAGELDWYEQIPYLACMQDAANELGKTDQAGRVAAMLNKMLAINGAGAFRQSYYYFCDPSIMPIPYYDGVGPLWNYSDGVGLYSRFDGGNLFSAFCPSRVGVDHENGYVADLMWYAGGEWVLRHPITYGGNANTAYGTNAVLVSGLSCMWDKGPVACETTADYTYYVGQTSGRYYGPWKTANPAPFCNELTRSILFLPKLNAIVVCDRIDSIDPVAALPDGNMWIYYQPDKDLINAAATAGPGHRHQINWHAPVAPTITTTAAAGEQPFTGVSMIWATTGSQQVQITNYSTTGPLVADTLLDRQFIANATGNQVRVHPADADRKWDVFLSVVMLNPENVVPKAIMEDNAAGWTIGDTTVYFGTDPSSRLVDPSKLTTSGKTYVVGCNGDMPVVIK